MSFSSYSPAALDFLRRLKRNNRRPWFNARKEIYEREIKAPTLALIDAVNLELMRFAPRYVTPANKAMLRIYRDTRFSANKAPYKSHISALFPRAGAGRTSGACFYFHFTAEELLIFAGVWNPPAEELRLIRPFVAAHYPELGRILRGRKLRELFGKLQGEQLTRVPAGFQKDHPAADWIRGKQWYLETTLPVRTLLNPNAIEAIALRFRAAAPLVEFFNAPLIARPRAPEIFAKFAAGF
jgi:uncharacterized protein (TIGR02453 family)